MNGQSVDFLETSDAPDAVGPYSQGSVAGGLVFVSGQLGLHPDTGAFAGEDFETQARQALANLGAVLGAAGCARTDIASVDVFLTDMGDFKAFNGIYAEFMAGHAPARAAIQVAGLPLGALVEVRCVAVAPKTGA